MKNQKIIPITGFVVFTVILLHYTGLFKTVDFLVFNFFKIPAIFVYDTAYLLESDVEKVSQEELKNMYKDIKSKYLDLLSKDTKTNVLEEENQELRKFLNFKNTKQVSLILANVVSKSGDLTASSILIDKGKRDGIEEGMSVIIGEGTMIGKIYEVSEDNSIVNLVYDNKIKIGVTIIGTEKTLGVLEGGYGNSSVIKLIPQTENIKIGDIVVTSKLESNTIEGLIIGKVTLVKKEKFEPFQEAVVESFLDTDKLKIAGVIVIN
jgi:rod shape-determining protein MreC